MASMFPHPPQNLSFSTTGRLSAPAQRPFNLHPPPRCPDSAPCRCSARDNSSSSADNSSSFHRRWDSTIQDVLKNAIRRFDSVMSLYQDKNERMDGVSGKRSKTEEGSEAEQWEWDRWMKHFEQVDEQERLLSVLKSQLRTAVIREDYKEAARLKVAIAAAATNDTVGRVMSQLTRAVVEERYKDAAFLRDKACAGLVGWWSGISEDVKDPYGIIIRITAEHGRYVARSYGPRQLTTSIVGAPLFEVFLTLNRKGEYKKQAVYLKWKERVQDPSAMSSNTLNSSSLLNPPNKKEDTNDFFLDHTEDEEEDNSTDDDSDLLEEPSGFQNFMRDMIPGLKVKVLKVTLPGKVDKNSISKVIEQIMDEDDDEDVDDEDVDAEDAEEDLEVDNEFKDEYNQEKNEIKKDPVGSEIVGSSVGGISERGVGSELTVKVVIGDTADRLSGNLTVKGSLRFPAKLETNGLQSFSFRLERNIDLEDSDDKEQASLKRKTKLQSKRSIDNLIYDLAKSIEKEKKMSLKMLKDVGELLNLTLNQAQNRQQLSGLTSFCRIDVKPSLDPLAGLYIGAHGLYTSEVIQLKRKFGHWKDVGSKKSSDIELYEYVEAVKLTGDPYVPAGKVAFRAKIGKHYELPHKGMIPEEFGVIARYKGQGRLAEPGYKNPKWVDGELVILDGKYIKEGPVVGFVYWAPESHFVVFFNRLRLQP